MTTKIKVIGVGGIGSWLVDPLAQYLCFAKESSEVTIIDGDKYEERNKTRQKFRALGNKAVSTVERLREEFPPSVHFRSRDEYLTGDNIISAIREDDIVFSCVDNKATRKLISERCQELNNVVLICGGNEIEDGDVIYYCRRNKVDITRSPADLYKSIANPDDVNPGVMTETQREGCEAAAQTNPQIIQTNLMVATVMLWVLRHHDEDTANFNQVFFDGRTMRMRPDPEPVITFQEETE